MHLNRVSTVYLGIFVVFAAGIWVILEVGSAFLTAPRDLTGVWRITGGQADSFSIAQSGRFVRFAVDGGSKFDVVLASASDGKSQTLNFDGQGWHVTGSGALVADSMNFTFRSPDSQPAPRSGTYQRQRMGQPGAPTVKSPTLSATPPPNAVH